MEDLKLYETGQGGDLSAENGELVADNTFSTSVYIALFGGEHTGDYWANKLLYNDNPDETMKSGTEHALQTYSLTKSNLTRIQSAVILDLECLKDLADITVIVELIGYSKLQIKINLIEKKTSENEQITLVWDGIKKGLQL